jgi:glutathione S-transferase
MKKLELYFYNECPYCQIVLSAIRGTKLEDKIIYLNTRENPANREQLIKDTGRGTVPCLYIDGVPMHESRDIAHWLEEYAKTL